MSSVRILNLKKKFGSSLAVSDFSLEVNHGELVAFLGPSGCGKTTTLRMIAGFIEPTAGDIIINDKNVTNVPVHKRNTGMVFQKYALFPHMTVSENVAFGLKMRKVNNKEATEKINNVLSMVQLENFSDRYPRQLSGGQQQRVALARALVIEPEVFLLDEPLSNLDAKLRVEVREQIRTLQKNLSLTTIFVTHDQEEAMAIADRIAIMNDGKIQQIGTPKELYEQPANYFVANFLGRMNFLSGKTENKKFISELGINLPLVEGQKISRVGVRPENTLISNQEIDGEINIPAVVKSVSYLGPVIDIKCQLSDGSYFNSTLADKGSDLYNKLITDKKVWINLHRENLINFE